MCVFFLTEMLVMCPRAVGLTNQSPVQTVIRPVRCWGTGFRRTLWVPLVNMISFLFSRYFPPPGVYMQEEDFRDFLEFSSGQACMTEGLMLSLF